jgi:hypothetical protein
MRSQTTINYQRAELKWKLAESVLFAAVCLATSLVTFIVAATAYTKAHTPAAVICGVISVASLAVMAYFIAEAVDYASKLGSREFNRR